jgi:hypothetical protein
MGTSKQMDMIKAEKTFREIVLPLLLKHSWSRQQINGMLPRIRFGKDYKNWSIRVEDRYQEDVPVIERTLRQPNGSSKLVLQAFVSNGRVISYGVIPVDLLSYVVNNKINCVDNINRREQVIFRNFRFDVAIQMFGSRCFVFNN